MDNDKKFEILLRKLAQCINLGNELGVDLRFPMKIAARSVLSNHKKHHDLEIAFILARPKTDAIQ